jgi:hypothetical protein
MIIEQVVAMDEDGLVEKRVSRMEWRKKGSGKEAPG